MHIHNHEHRELHHTVGNYNRAFAIGIALNLSFVIFEATCGVLSNSFALLADAGHNSSDVISLILAWVATLLTRLPASQRYTYGLRSASILATVMNSILLVVAMLTIGWQAIATYHRTEPMAIEITIFVASIGIIVNTATALMFMSGSKTDMNIRGAFLHMAADAGLSLGVVIAGIDILLTGWLWYDSFITLVFVGVILSGTWELLKDSVNLALHAVPEWIDPMAVKTYLTELPGVMRVSNLHIWAISTTEVVLTASLLMPKGHPGDDFLAQVRYKLHGNFGIEQATLEIEIGTLQNCIQGNNFANQVQQQHALQKIK
jgi:cobalt-zinc-cadmium efflux system protein